MEKKISFSSFFSRPQIRQKVTFNISNGLLLYYPSKCEHDYCFLKIRNGKKILYSEDNISLTKFNFL